ncbi:formate/nitrite transporter family protein [Exiguobacterium alkaliphilum]|uniref:Formate/nitrite transporter family protein n=1 Tax=Exiguobacterium alkaliphilum TaxID=1428684 RepID=A0ABT2KX50_9BACL|nr:formate/nitrite transporter family protein [Exiguobacterium alkaliphilum]MCT4795507.1 formate/nitrite transporter family protein [Exiguobacterium alkaliphilum]
MEKQIVDYMEEAAHKKTTLLRHAFGQYALRSIVAGFLIGIGVVFAFSVGNMFIDVPGTMLFAGMSFSVALVFIVWMGGELFTSNTMYLYTGAKRKRVSWRDLLAVWGVSWVGNLVGALLLVALVVGAHSMGEVGSDHLLAVVAAKKMGTDAFAIFLKGILCNVLVCIAIFMPLKTQHDVAKIMLTMLPVVAFFAAGFEHSIANMGIFGLALYYAPSEMVNVGLALNNLLFATLGNIVGGALFVAATYLHLNAQTSTNVESIRQNA